MTSASAIAISGMSAAQATLRVSAHNIANLGSGGFRRQHVSQTAESGGGVSTSVSQAAQPDSALETDVVGLLQAKNSFLANLAVFRTGDRMTRALLDLVG